MYTVSHVTRNPLACMRLLLRVVTNSFSAVVAGSTLTWTAVMPYSAPLYVLVCLFPDTNSTLRITKQDLYRAVPWLRRFVAGLAQRSPGSVHVGFVVDGTGLSSLVPCQYHSTMVLNTHIKWGWTIGPWWLQFRDIIPFHQHEQHDLYAYTTISEILVLCCSVLMSVVFCKFYMSY
jgi:hypothetical protein